MHHVISLAILFLSVVHVVIAQDDVVRGPLGERLDSLFSNAEKNGFHGNALVARRDEVVLLKGYGIANHATNARVAPSTLVQIGSNVKDFTKTAIYQLVEQSRLHLSDSLGRFIEGLATEKRRITVGNLLEHTAGLPLGFARDDHPLTKDEILERLGSLQLLSAPGTEKHYSNLGYSLLALIIERVSGQSYDAYVAEQILAPLGMRETGSYLPKFDRARIAHGYRGTEDNGIILDMPHDAEGHLWSLRGNGGYLSTLSDMYRFYRALRDSTLLRNPEHRRAIFDTDRPGVLAGSDMVCFFLFANFPGVGTDILMSTNHAEFKANRLMGEIQSLLGIAMRGGPGIETEVSPGDRDKTPTGEREITAPMMNKLPDNGVGHTIGEYIEAFNTSDTTAMRRFFTERALSGPDTPPIDVRLQRYRNMRSDLGRLTFRGIRQSPEGEGWAVSVATESGPPATLTFLIEENPPHRMKRVGVMVGD